MDKIKKFLRQLPPGDFRRVLKILEKLETSKTKGLDIKKLTGYKSLFRVRAGVIRIIFLRTDNEFRLISIERRSDTTYRRI